MVKNLFGFIVFLFLFYSKFLSANYDALIEQLKLFGFNEYPDYVVSENATIVESDRFVFDLSQGNIKSLSGVRLSKADLLFSSSKFNYNINDQIFNAENNVQLLKDDLIIRCNSLTALQKLNFVKGFGDVLFEYQSFRGISEQFEYDLNAQQIDLIENAEIKQDGDFIRGSVVKFDIRHEKIISKGKSKIKISTERLKK